MPKRHYLLALACYLAIPAAVIAGAAVHRLIDPEMARGHADYVRDYWLLELVRAGVLMAAAGLALLLWISTCALVLKSRQRSPRWLPLAAAGPFGFVFIAMLEDRSPAPGAYECVVLTRELMIRYESSSTGTPVATIIARQSASSGMWAAGEGLEEISGPNVV